MIDRNVLTNFILKYNILSGTPSLETPIFYPISYPYRMYNPSESFLNFDKLEQLAITDYEQKPRLLVFCNTL